MSDGVVYWDGGWTWYRVEGELGEDGSAPLVTLHGGPGGAHDYVEPIADLARIADRPCVLYDQIGCGRSQHLPDAPVEFWTVELFRRELAALLDQLGIARRYHVLGQSWGGMLGMEHALEHPPGLRSLIVADSPASIELWVQEANRLRRLLPVDVQDVLTPHEAAGTTDSEEYQAAVMGFYERHLCRVPFPDGLQRTFAQIAEDPTVYHTMNGPSEFHVIGTLRDWDITPRLGDVRVPVLVISGEHDEATPAVVRPLVDALPDARWELLDGASHCPHLEQPERFLELTEGFSPAHDEARVCARRAQPARPASVTAIHVPTGSIPMSSMTIRSARIKRPIARFTLSSARWRRSITASDSRVCQATLLPRSIAKCPSDSARCELPVPLRPQTHSASALSIHSSILSAR